jgi:nicotinamidase-related amidase
MTLLLLDLMNGLVERFPDHNQMAEKWSLAATAARSCGIPVVYVRLGFRPGYPEIHLNNRLFAAVAQSGHLLDGDPGAAIYAPIAPGPKDVVVTKKRVSAFSGSDLDFLLRASGTDTLILAGLVTSGVVLATLVDACDRDYRCTILEDACGDTDEVLHEVLMRQFFPLRGVVQSTGEWVDKLQDSTNNHEL